MNPDQLTASVPPALRATGQRLRGPHFPLAEEAAPAIARATDSLLRAFDLVVACALLMVLAAPMLVIGWLVKLSSRGPALYRQERTGRNGKTFTMYKFRTMRVDAENHTGPVWTKPGDPRRTLLGIILRRTSLDELPQIINVLRGEMSLVGPRPERPFFVESFSRDMPHYSLRHAVLPGITGWAQVNGWRGDTSIEKRLEYDLYYIRHRSLWLNLRIMLRTPLKMLFEKNAC